MKALLFPHILWAFPSLPVSLTDFQENKGDYASKGTWALGVHPQPFLALPFLGYFPTPDHGPGPHFSSAQGYQTLSCVMWQGQICLSLFCLTADFCKILPGNQFSFNLADMMSNVLIIHKYFQFSSRKKKMKLLYICFVFLLVTWFVD